MEMLHNIMLPQVPLRSISMLGNTMFEPHPRPRQLFNKFDDHYDVMLRCPKWYGNK